MSTMGINNETATAKPVVVPRPQKLMARLRRDIMEFQNNPYTGISMSIHDEQITEACLVLTPQDGPLRGLNLHFDVVLPPTWPTVPPKVRCSYDLDHPNIFGGWGGKGAYVCCDLLKTEGEIYSESSYTGGYHPALTLRALALQLLSFFSSRLVEQDGGYNAVVGEEVATTYYRGALDEEMIYSFASQGCLSDWDRKTGKDDELAKDVEAALKNTKSHKQFRYFSNTWQEVVSQDKAGRWEGWLRGEKAPLAEVEIVRAGHLARFRKRNPRWSQSYNKLRSFQCDKCGCNKDGVSAVDAKLLQPLKFTLDRLDGNEWTAAEWKAEQKTGAKDAPLTTPACHLDNLNNDVLLCIAQEMSSETILSFNAAYPRFKAVTATAHTLILRELECFFLRTPINSSGRPVLGIGISVESYQKNLGSNFDILSLEAFNQYNVRKGIDKSTFEYFLPLWFSAEHYARAKNVVWDRLQSLQFAIMFKVPNLHDGRALAWSTRARVLYKFMNNIVVTLMKSADDLLPKEDPDHYDPYARDNLPKKKASLLLASEKSVNAYCQLFQLLRKVSETAPGVVKSCSEVVEKFRLSERARNKNESPDLGEVIIMFCLVLIQRKKDMASSWANFVGPFMEENFTRNVRWVLDKEPDLARLENGASDKRLKLTFQHSKTSLRLVMFQVFFCRFISIYGPTLDVNYGFPPSSAAEMVVKEIKSIYAVNTWKDYFRKIGYARGQSWTKEKFCEKLKERVTESQRRGYHNPQMVKRAYAAIEAEKNRKQAEKNRGPTTRYGCNCELCRSW